MTEYTAKEIVLTDLDGNYLSPIIDKELFGNKVSKSGDTMTGSLTVTKNGHDNFIAKNPEIDITTTPDSNKFIGLDIRDKNDARCGWLGYVHSANGYKTIQLQCIAGSSTSNIFSFGFDANGKVYYSRPQIISSYISGNSGYKVWSDGYCIQWGRITSSNSDVFTASFVKTFSNTSYNLQATAIRSGATYYYTPQITGHNVDKATIKLVNGTANSCHISWVAMGQLAEGQY